MMSSEKLRISLRRRSFGLGLVAFFILAACSKTERDFDRFREPNGGSSNGSGGSGSSSGGASSGGAGGEGEGGAGGVPGVSCEGNVDPDCECVEGSLVARDVDGDGEGTRLCEASPGVDCDDGDPEFVQNVCGGCNKDLGALVLGEPCQQCGVVQCQGDSALVCGTPNPAPRSCTGNTPRVCVAAQWVNQTACAGATAICFEGNCVQCTPGTFRCDLLGSGSSTSFYATECLSTGSWASSTTSCGGLNCTTSQGCTGSFHPRDAEFEVPSLLAPRVPGLEPARTSGRPTLEVLDRATGFDFG